MKYDFSVIILIYNHKKYLRNLVNKLFSYRKNFKIEVVILDSGSSDGSKIVVEDLRKKHKDVSYKYFENSYFNHGLTRDFGVRCSNGRFVVFISADALPISDNFFKDFFSIFTREKELIACYGSELVKKSTVIVQRLDLLMLYKELDNYARGEPLIISEESKLPDRIKYSLNNVFSSYHRSYLLKHPFGKISYGEDLIAGRKILKKGYKVAYLPRCRVLHSHSFSIVQYFKRQVEDFKVRYKEANLNLNVTFFQKLAFILSMKGNFLVKAGNVLELVGYYSIKCAAFLYSRFS